MGCASKLLACPYLNRSKIQERSAEGLGVMEKFKTMPRRSALTVAHSPHIHPCTHTYTQTILGIREHLASPLQREAAVKLWHLWQNFADKCHVNCLYISIKHPGFETWQDDIHVSRKTENNVQITAATSVLSSYTTSKVMK